MPHDLVEPAQDLSRFRFDHRTSRVVARERSQGIHRLPLGLHKEFHFAVALGSRQYSAAKSADRPQVRKDIPPKMLDVPGSICRSCPAVPRSEDHVFTSAQFAHGHFKGWLADQIPRLKAP